ncbi:hypothetical protein E5C26_06480 [Serratia proteamaculans]|uniref:MrpH family fimbial adhesin n=1 Tax=Serratia proteamaculans TaxID=28151 RepID=UPI0010769F86|nr:hypothetical protein [Serratia proteamaculans]TFZ52362.1 hypothetical protein E5C26_06480 [Serratia proteamaculans]
MKLSLLRLMKLLALFIVVGCSVTKAYSAYFLDMKVIKGPAPPVAQHLVNWSAYMTGKVTWYDTDDKEVICHNSRGCAVLLCYPLLGAGGFTYCLNYLPIDTSYGRTLPMVVIPNNGTERDAQVAWDNKIGNFSTMFTGPSQATPTMQHVTKWYKNVCVRVMISQSNVPRNDGYGVKPDPTPMRGGNAACAYIPPYDLTCTTNGKVEIDYGTLDGNKLNGSVASTNLSFTCNQDATAIIRLDRNSLDLGRKGDLTAEISIDGKNLGTTTGSNVAVTNGTVTTTITSTLKAKGTPAAGPFEGSGVLIIGYN